MKILWIFKNYLKIWKKYDKAQSCAVKIDKLIMNFFGKKYVEKKN